MQSLMETILCNSIVAEDVVVVDGWMEYETTHRFTFH
jgi:hypothetical protein